MAKLFVLYWSVTVDIICSIFVGVTHLPEDYWNDHCGMVRFAKIASSSFGKEVFGDEKNQVEEFVKQSLFMFCCLVSTSIQMGSISGRVVYDAMGTAKMSVE